MSAVVKPVDSVDEPRSDRVEDGQVALVIGAGSGIGLGIVEALLADHRYASVYAGCRDPDGALALRQLQDQDSRLNLLRVDVTDASSIRDARARLGGVGKLDLLFNTAGVLHSAAGMQPEKRLADVDTDDLLLAYDVNALGMLRLAMEMEPLLKASKQARFVNLSARVGSISDNRLGGWYAYRASKAALNMLVKTLAIEWSRALPGLICVALHPGTVETALSKPFTKNSNVHKLFTPSEAAANLLHVLECLTPEQSGRFFAWDGEEIPW